VTVSRFDWTTAPSSQIATVARSLLGWELSAGAVRLRLTELEAYRGSDDPASHAYRGKTPRTAVMFGPAGVAYVYFVFGMHWCLNVVVEPAGRAAAVLLRAGEVVSGVDVARGRRGLQVADRDLARGPARLAQALGVDGSLTGTSLLDGPIRLGPGDAPVGPILSGPRVGVVGGADTPWRFWLAGDPTVSPYRPHTPRRRR